MLLAALEEEKEEERRKREEEIAQLQLQPRTKGIKICMAVLGLLTAAYWIFLFIHAGE